MKKPASSTPLSTNKHLLRWVKKISDLCKPAAIHWIDGSKREYDRLCEQMVATNALIKLNPKQWPGCFCGILCFGFGRARCASCGQGFVVAFSCKGRGVCPSCNGRRMAQTAAHLVDRVIPPVPVRQWVISVPKRLRCFLADRPSAVAALTRIFIEEIERLLCTAAGSTRDGHRPSEARPRLGAVSFLHRFGSALNHHVHLHACATDGVFVPTGGGPPAFLPARPITQADLATLTEKVRRRAVRWFRMQRLIDADAASDMLRWENSGFSVDASVRITLIDRDVPSYFQSLEHLLRYCARPPFALERLSVMRGEDGRIACVRYVLPRHKAANWVGPGRGRKSTRPGASGVVELSPFEFLDRLADLVPPPRKHRHRYHGVYAVGGHAADGDATCHGCDSCDKLPSHDTSRIAWAKLMARVGEEFPFACPGCGGDIRLIAFITDPGPIRKVLTHLGEALEPPPVSPARGPPTDWGELVQVHFRPGNLSGTDRRAARHRYP